MRMVWPTVFVSIGLLVVGGCRTKTVDGEGEPSEDGGISSSSSSGGTNADAGRDRNEPPREDPLTPVTSGTTGALRGVWLSADLAFAVAVGENGVIVTSDDAGKTWEPSTSGVTTKLNAVWGSGADDVWIVGDGATILHSTNRGGQWTSVSLGVQSTPSLTAVWGSGKDQFFVGSAGGDLFRSRDEGVSFPISLNAVSATEVTGISGTSATDIWAARGFRIMHSVNGGDTWQEINAQNIYAQHGLWAGGPQDIYTINANGIVRRYDSTAGPEGTLYLSKLDSALCFGCLELRGIAGTAPSDVWVVGEKGFAAHSTAHGEWREAAAGSGDLFGVASVNGVLLAVGSGGTIMRR